MVAARERVLTAGLVDDVRPGCRTRPHSVDRRVRWPFQLPDTPRTPWEARALFIRRPSVLALTQPREALKR
jgi:hypothetical protein